MSTVLVQGVLCFGYLWAMQERASSRLSYVGIKPRGESGLYVRERPKPPGNGPQSCGLDGHVEPVSRVRAEGSQGQNSDHVHCLGDELGNKGVQEGKCHGSSREACDLRRREWSIG